jgi:hypothetical protein
VVGHLTAAFDTQDLDPSAGELGRTGQDVRVVGVAPERQDGVVLEQEQLVADEAVGTLGGEAALELP